MAKTILVTGKDGQLGRSIQKIASQYTGLDFTYVGRDILDLSSSSVIEKFFSENEFDVVINCAAYTAVDKAESEIELADKINHLAVKKMAEMTELQGAKLIHVSTDYVFNGQSFKPYVESDKTDPINVYGVTKLKGEQAVLATNSKGAIIRTSWVYSEFGNNFVKTMLRLGVERESLGIIFDQVGSPTYAVDLASAILDILSNSTDQLDGVQIYHFSNEGVCSWYDFANAIFSLSNIKCNVSPIEACDYPTPAKRPYYSVMNKNKIKQAFNLDIPYWQESLKVCLQELQG